MGERGFRVGNLIHLPAAQRHSKLGFSSKSVSLDHAGYEAEQQREINGSDGRSTSHTIVTTRCAGYVRWKNRRKAGGSGYVNRNPDVITRDRCTSRWVENGEHEHKQVDWSPDLCLPLFVFCHPPSLFVSLFFFFFS